MDHRPVERAASLLAHAANQTGSQQLWGKAAAIGMAGLERNPHDCLTRVPVGRALYRSGQHARSIRFSRTPLASNPTAPVPTQISLSFTALRITKDQPKLMPVRPYAPIKKAKPGSLARRKYCRLHLLQRRSSKPSSTANHDAISALDNTLWTYSESGTRSP